MGRSAGKIGLWLLYSDLLRLLRSVSRLGGYWKGSWKGEENYLESQICVLNYFEKSTLILHNLML